MSKRKLIFLGSLYVLVSALSVGLTYNVAYASHWLGGTAYKAGDRDVYFHQCELDYYGNTHETFHDNGDHDIGPTVITRHEVHGCNIVDVRVVGEAYGTNMPTGWYHCHKNYSANGCDKGEVHINTSYGNIPEVYSRTLRLMCEEIGHSVGLGHRSDPDSCMSGSTAAHLDAHDKEAINNNY